MLISDKNMIPSTMNGVPYKVATVAHNLRMKLCNEHLGLPNEDKSTSDPLSHHFYNIMWKQVSSMNTSIYSKVFPTAPHNKLFSLKTLQTSCPYGESYSLLSGIKGHLIDFAAEFLSVELNQKFTDIEVVISGDEVFV